MPRFRASAEKNSMPYGWCRGAQVNAILEARGALIKRCAAHSFCVLPARVQNFADFLEQRRAYKRLLKDGGSGCCHAMVRDHLIGMTRHEDDSCGWRLRGNLPGEFHAAGDRHHDVGENQVNGRPLLPPLTQRFGAITCLDHEIARARKRLNQHLPKQCLVLDQQYRLVPFQQMAALLFYGFAAFAHGKSREEDGKLRALAWFANHRDGSLILAEDFGYRGHSEAGPFAT